MDITTVLIIGAVIGVVAWALAFLRGRVDASDVGRGLLHGLVFSAAVLLAIAALGTLFLNGRDFLGGTVGFGEALALGLLAGAVVGIGYFLAGAALMPVGLLYRKSRDWALYGTWVAVVIVIVSVGLGWTAYNAYVRQGIPPPTPLPTRPATT